MFSGGSATSSPAMLGIRRHSSNYQRAQSSMQLDTYYGDNSLHKRQYTGLWHSSGICTRAAGVFSQTTTISVWSYIYFTLYLWIFHLRVREENPIFHWDLFLPVRRGSEKIPGKKPFVVSSYSNVVLNHPGKDVFSVWLILYRLTDYIVFQAPRAILRRTRQEELQQLQNVPVVPTRLRRGALWGWTGPPDPVFSRRLRHPVAPIQSQHQLCGLLLHHTEAFKQGEQVHRLPRLVGVERKQTPWTSSLHHVGCPFLWVYVCGECVVWLRERLRMHVDMYVCVYTEAVLNDQGLVCHVQLLTKSDRTIIIPGKKLSLYFWLRS